MSAKSPLSTILCLVLLLPFIGGWQDDVDLITRDPKTQFTKNPGLAFVGSAQSQARVGRYLAAADGHAWKGGVEGDVALINYDNRFLWHLGLNIETLADDKNDIYFRLIRVYYQGLTGIKWPLGPGLFYAGYRHRCNHGTDRALKGRITIRSGPIVSYQLHLAANLFQFDITSGVNIYTLGQNMDIGSQPRGNVFLTTNILRPLWSPFFVVASAGLTVEMVTEGDQFVYFLHNPFSKWSLEPLWAARLALRFDQGAIKTDIGLLLSQQLDTGVGDRAEKTQALSLDFNFLW